MNHFLKLVLSGLFLITTLPALAQIQIGGKSEEYLKELRNYLKNLGGYIGYNLEEEPQSPQSGLIFVENKNAELMNAALNLVFYTSPAAAAVNAFSDALKMVVPKNSSYATYLNRQANVTFNDQSIFLSSIDQKTYQKDPVSQNVLDILATPNYTYCMNYDQSRWDDCKALRDSEIMSSYEVMKEVIGTVPRNYFEYSNISQFLPELNSNTLVTPFIYNKEEIQPEKGAGLKAKNQVQAAANFIRYATGAVAPLPMPEKEQYNTLYNRANDSKASELERKSAENALISYLTRIRTYAAQMSVGFGNLYYIFSKRVSQNIGGKETSQALSEYKMATWRLYDPTAQGGQWALKINKASPATVQKEIAILLSEINYQMYLNRQQEERILLTNTITMMQNLKLVQPALRAPTAAE